MPKPSKIYGTLRLGVSADTQIGEYFRMPEVSCVAAMQRRLGRRLQSVPAAIGTRALERASPPATLN